MAPLAEAVTVSLLSLFIYLLGGNSVVGLLMAMAGLGFTVNLSFMRRSLIADKSWIIMLGGTAYTGLSIALSNRVIALSTSLILILLMLSITSHISIVVTDRDLDLLIITGLIAGLIGSVMRLEYTPWVILSPVIEYLLSSTGGEELLGRLYYVVSLSLLLLLHPLLLAYVFALNILRQYFKPLNTPSNIWADMVFRVVLVVMFNA
ncbi:MAG: hypothetical protein QXP97_00730 [Desulfurococcus sp.]|uniref:hypothetical protein n=1 Tax=Desulfurococcus sp. TaxID=51678 RepID=UPI003167E226